METQIQQKERKLVPRFRRKNVNPNLIDADDEEAQALIEKDLQSHFIWTSDTIENSKYQFDNEDNNQQQQQHISISDEINKQFNYDIEHDQQQLWKFNNEENNEEFIQWTHDQQENQISFSIQTNQQEQKWTLNDKEQQQQQINLFNSDDQQYKHDLETIYSNQPQTFLQGEQFLTKMKFGLESDEDEFNVFLNDSEDIRLISFDSNIPSKNSTLSLPQGPIVVHYIEGISHYTLSLPNETFSKEYSPLNQSKFELDSNNLKVLQWSLDLLKENLIYSYLISLPNTDNEQISLPENFHLKLSMDEDNQEQKYSVKDSSFKQILSFSSNDLKNQLLSIIDLFQIQQNFGNDERKEFYQWNLKDFQIILQNLSPEEIINYFYSPTDVKPISYEELLIDSDEISARAFRRYRCKHMSIKNEEKDQLDSCQDFHLQFNGNQQIAIGEEQIQNDFNEEQIYRDITTNDILLQEDFNQTYDITINKSSPMNFGPCLYRSDYEREPPKTWSSLRREIGYISYDASLTQPIYYFDKSFKRFVHIPKDRNQCSYNVYRGYQEFKEKIQLNPENYLRPHDGTDLRPLLSWYSQKQYLFSSKNVNLLKPPTFLCRRLVLRTILANLYCDSDPWKLLVIRIKGQFYLAIANKATKQAENLTEDEYSGYKFEDLFTTDQPNSTRFKEDIPIEKPQEQFHTVQYWQFGEFNLLYSNEIDGEITDEMINKLNTTNFIKQEDNLTKLLSTEESEIKSMNTEEENPIEDEIKVAQINENLQLIESDENEIIEKKKRNENEIKAGYVEMKCTNKKIFYRDENKLQTLYWWAQMWLANVHTLMIGYKTTNDGNIDHLDLFSIQKLISKFLSRYDLHLKYCLSYLYSFLQLIQQTILIDDPNTIHAFAYIPQPLEIDPLTGKPLQVDLPQCVPFRYTQMKRSNQRHSQFMPQWYLQDIQRTIPIITGLIQIKTIQEETKQRIGHRGRSSCILKQQQKQTEVKRKRKHK